MPPWLAQIKYHQKKEIPKKPSRWVQLATISLDNTPRVRTVVFRGWTNLYEMKIFIDKRSEKFDELKYNNNVEVCWLFKKSKCQFRFRGNSTLAFCDETTSAWEQLDDKAKSMWGWPSPGDVYTELFDNHKIIEESSNNVNNFVLLKINISQVDQLIIGNPKHIRRQWIRKNNWTEERLNP